MNKSPQNTPIEMTTQSFWNHRLFWGLVAMVFCCSYVAFHLQTGWFPHDEGQLGQAAERVLQGELPHRDFDEMYTGGLTFLNAFAFETMGVRSESTRWMLWFWFVPFAGTLFWISCRAAPAWVAALITFFCGSITIPVYSAAMPSWYNLFLMVFGIGCLLKFIDGGQTRWLVAAGCFAGLSILFKITGLYWLAAAMLFLVYYEQQTATKESDLRPSRIYDAIVIGCLTLFGLIGFAFCKSHDHLMSAIHLTIPLWLIAVFLSWQQVRTSRGDFRFRMKRLLRLQTPLLAAALVPVLLFVGFYAWHGAWASIYEGLVVMPRQRLSGAHTPFPGWSWLACAIPLAAIFSAGLFEPGVLKKSNRRVRYIAWATLIAGLSLSWFWSNPAGFQLTFQSFRNLGPFVCAIGMIWLAFPGTQMKSIESRLQVFLVLVCLALGCLVQFPFASDFYFLYAAPLLVVAILFLSREQEMNWRWIHIGILCGLTIFSVRHMASPIPNANIQGISYGSTDQSVGLERCSLRVSGSSAVVYHELVAEIRKRTREGDYIFAGPDFPEAYFLSGRRNPTRVFYDFFRPEMQQHPEVLLQVLENHQVDLVVLKKFQAFSELASSFEKEIERRYPHQKRINRYQQNPDREPEVAFVIYWRDSDRQKENSAD